MQNDTEHLGGFEILNHLEGTTKTLQQIEERLETLKPPQDNWLSIFNDYLFRLR